MVAPVLEASGIEEDAQTASSFSFSVNVPGGLSNSFIVLSFDHFEVARSVTSATVGTGGTQQTATQIGTQVDSLANAREGGYLAFVTSPEDGATVDVTINLSGNQSGGVILHWFVYSGVDQTNPINDSQGFTHDGTTGLKNFSLVTTVDNCAGVAFIHDFQIQTHGNISVWTENQVNGDSGGIIDFSESWFLADFGPAATENFTWSGSGSSIITTAAVAIAPFVSPDLSGTAASISGNAADLSVEGVNGPLVAVGNVTPRSNSTDATGLRTETFNHDNNGSGLLILNIIHDAASNVTAGNVSTSATYDGVPVPSIAVSQDNFQDDVPRIEAFYLESAASGDNECVVNMEFLDGDGIQAYEVIAISMQNAGAAGPNSGANTSDTNVGTLSATINATDLEGLIIGASAAQGNDTAPHVVGAGYTLVTQWETGTANASDAAGLVQARRPASTGNQAFDASWAVSDDSSILAVEILQAASSGTDLSGTAGALSGSSAGLQIEKRLSGTAGVLSGSSAGLQIEKRLSGDGAVVSGTAANLQVAKHLSGTAASLSGAASDLRIAKEIAGTSASVSGTTANLQLEKQLSGAATSVSGSTADLELREELSGIAASVSGSVSNLQIQKNIEGTAASVSGSAANLVSGGNLAGILAGVSGSAANLQLEKELSGSVDATSALFGNLSGDVGLLGTAASVSGSAGSLQLEKRLAAVAASVSGASSNLQLIKNLASVASSISGTAVNLVLEKRLAGLAAGVSGSTANLATGDSLQGLIAGVSGSQALLSLAQNLAGSADATSTLSGALVGSSTLSGAVSSVSILTGDLVLEKRLAGAASSVSSLVALLELQKILAGLAAGVSGSAATLSLEHRLLGTIAAVSFLEGTLTGVDQEVTNFGADVLDGDLIAQIDGGLDFSGTAFGADDLRAALVASDIIADVLG